MASDKQIAANRANAKKSTGPRTAAGRAKSSRNAYRHGLSLPMQPDPEVVEALTRAIAGDAACEDQLKAARAVAEAQLELKRNRKTKLAATLADLDPRMLAELRALGRYERLAASRRKAAAKRWLDEISSR